MTIRKIKDLLADQLNHSQAGVTKKQVACLIISYNNNVYLGCNTEHAKPICFEHAEADAIARMRQAKDDSGIKNIYLAGRGQVKMKQISPCEECYNLILPLMKSKSFLTLFEPNSLDSYLVFSFDEIHNAYSKLEYSRIKQIKKNLLLKELKNKTFLRGKDLNFIADLRLFGLVNNIEFYLTGSSSGRAGIAQLINEKMNREYEDIDLIAISSQNQLKVEMRLKNFIEKYYSGLTVNKRIFKFYFTNEFGEVNQYFDQSNKKVIEITIGNSVEKAMHRNDYLKNNWFHRLS